MQNRETGLSHISMARRRRAHPLDRRLVASMEQRSRGLAFGRPVDALAGTTRQLTNRKPGVSAPGDGGATRPAPEGAVSANRNDPAAVEDLGEVGVEGLPLGWPDCGLIRWQSEGRRDGRLFRTYRQMSGWNPPPLMIRAFGAHCRLQTEPASLLLWG
jgi:hypothetical protein